MTQAAVSPPHAAPRTMSLDDFMTGVIAGLADRGVRVVSIRGNDFYAAIEDAFIALVDRAADLDIDLLFHISRSRMYGDSPDVREGISRAVQRDLVSLDNPEYQDMRIKLSSRTASRYMERLPGGADLFQALADKFLAHYPNFA